MPSNLLKLSSSSVESESHNHSDFERSGSLDSQSSLNSRSRSFNMDDENMKYLTSEEKNALLFLEETLYAFEDDIEEPPVSVNSSFSYSSPRSMEDGHSDSDDIIDLVQAGHKRQGVLLETGSGPTTNGPKSTQNVSRLLDVTGSASVPVPILARNSQRLEDHFPSELPVDYPRCLGAVPTPVILAQKISEKKTENVHLSSVSPKDEKSSELKKSVATSPTGDSDFAFSSKRFPNNISVNLGGKQYNKTIAKAAVNVQERKAQVLANLHGPALFSEEINGNHNDQLIRKASFRDVATEQARHEALTKLGLVKEIAIQANTQTSACTSPVSNGQHSPKFFPPEIQRRLSNEKVNTNNQPSSKALTPEANKKISNERHVISGQNSSKFFTTETKKVPSKEQDDMSGPHSTKVLAEQSNRRPSNEQVNINVQHSQRVLSPESNLKISDERHVINGQNPSKFFMTETKRVPSKEQDNMSGQHSTKVLAEQSNRRSSNEQVSINVQHLPKVLSPESNIKISKEHHVINGQNSSKILSAEPRRMPSKEQDDMSGQQHSPKVLVEEPNRRLSNEHESLSKILRSEHSSFVPMGKSIVIKGDTAAAPLDASKRQSVHLNNEQKQPTACQDIKRTYSVPRPSGFRPQGITVQFSGSESSDETRKKALRMLGLLKGQSGQ